MVDTNTIQSNWPPWARDRVRDAWMQGRIKAAVWYSDWPVPERDAGGMEKAVANLPTTSMVVQALKADADLWQDVAEGNWTAHQQATQSQLLTLTRILDWGVAGGGYALRRGETVCDLCPLTMERWTDRPRRMGCTNCYRERYLMRVYYEDAGNAQVNTAYRRTIAALEAQQLREVARKIEREAMGKGVEGCSDSERSST